jgi:hypothetical protein
MGSRTQPSLRRLAGRLAEMPRRQQPPSVQLPLHGGVPFARRRLRVRRGGSANRVARAWRSIRGACKLVPVFHPSFPRRQQARRLRRAAASCAAAIAAGTLAVIAAGAGAPALAGLLVLVMAALVVDARRWVRLGARSRVGAQSEALVRRALSGLEAEGWRLRHSLLWGERGDIDSVAIAPTGVAYAIVFCPAEAHSSAFRQPMVVECVCT